ncbi:MAG: neutral/alkaline non-lysosomal ceramidase N-terminal domain-containing protein [Treponema sp.]|nr:neutral/alkaline non-lysosomal ceramidase N-terminal domain-containing protein [Treponema sp.]
MLKIITAILAASFMLASCSNKSEDSGAAAANGAIGTVWTAGYGQAELIPPDMDSNTYWIAGYAVDKAITGVLDYQMAKALWLDDNSGRGGIVIAVVDCIGLPRADVEKIRKMLTAFREESGCRSINIISTHSHAGVDTLGLWGPIGVSGRSPEFTQVVYDGVVSAVKQAYNSRQDGRLYYGTVVTEGIQRDSRPPEVFDSTLHSLRFVASNGNGIRVINYAAHPEALGSRNTMISADFPAYMASHIKLVSGDDAIYIPGAIGGLIATRRQTSDDGEELPELESTVLTGQRLADIALGITNERELAPNVAVYSKEVVLPVDNKVYVISAFLGAVEPITLPRGGRHRLSMVTEAGLLQLGDISIFLVPGELFPELAYGGAAGGAGVNPLMPTARLATLTSIAGEGFLIFGLCNDEIGYIVPPGDFFLHETTPYLQRGVDATGRSHYEETNSVGPLTAPLIIEALYELKGKSEEIK